MSDIGDRAQSEQEHHLAVALEAHGIKSRVTDIPPPHYEPDPMPAFCRTCGGKPEVGALCGPCSYQFDKGGR